MIDSMMSIFNTVVASVVTPYYGGGIDITRLQTIILIALILVLVVLLVLFTLICFYMTKKDLDIVKGDKSMLLPITIMRDFLFFVTIIVGWCVVWLVIEELIKLFAT